MNVIYSVKLNVSEKNVLKTVIAKQKDCNSRHMDCALFHGRKMLLIRSGDVVVNARRADGQYRSFAGTINDNGTVRIPLSNWMLEEAGTLSCSVSIYEDDEKLTTATFEIEVQSAENPTGTVSPDDPNVDLAEQLVERCEAAVQQIETEFKGAGIHGETYTTVFDTVTAETSIHSNKEHPWVMLSATIDLINTDAKYRITFDGIEYIYAKQYWFIESYIAKGVGFLGNASLWGDVSGFTEEVHDAPFLITGNMDNGDSSYTEGLYLFTETEGQHTVKIERITYDYTKLPTELVYGRSREAVNVVDNGTSSYFGYSIGTGNSLVSKRATFAIGCHNIISGDSSKTFGSENTISGNSSHAVGLYNTITSVRSYAFGGNNTVSGQESCAVGKSNTASGANSTAIGTGCTASGQYSTAVGTSSQASGIGSLALGSGATASGTIATAIGQGSIAKNVGQLVFGMNNVLDPSENPSTEKGDYVEIVGNGANKNNRSNARTLDWSGNESLAGSITLGKGTEDEVTLTAAQLKRLLELL